MGIDLSVKIGKLKLKNPVMVASGTFGYGKEYSELVDLTRLGAIVSKTITLKPRKGNPPPRLVETPAGMLNSIGLQNDGIQDFIREKLPFLRKSGIPVIASISGETIDEFTQLSKILEKAGDINGLELNLSCPNIKSSQFIPLLRSGRAVHSSLISQDAKATYEVVKSVRKVTKKTLITKLSPDVTDIVTIAKSAQRAGSDAVSLINTISAMAVDIDTKKPKLGTIAGGLSGPAVKPIALRMVWEVARTVKIPVIGIGGIMNSEDALEFFIAGAWAVAIGTANFINPCACIEIIKGIELFLKNNKMDNIRSLIGSIKSP